MTGNEPAFPTIEKHESQKVSGHWYHLGMTKREWVATHILQGWASNPEAHDVFEKAEMVDMAVGLADKLIERCK